MNRVKRLPRAGVALARRVAEEVHGITSRACRATSGRGFRVTEPVPGPERLAAIRRRADAALADNVLPFWASHAWDEGDGGFITHLDQVGRRLGPTDKHLVPQTRLIWTLAAAHRHGLADRGYLELAGRGARFLVDRMWDPGAGGFVWAVRRDGRKLVPDKRTLGQVFAIYALAEYALVAQDPWARGWAVRTLDVLVDRAGDGDLGFRERFDADWMPLPGPAGSGKTVNVHLHVVEALTALVEATRDPGHAARLRSVLLLVLSRGVDARRHHTIDGQLDGAWRRLSRWRWPIGVSYGHGAELAWLAGRAVEVLEDPPEPVRECALRLVDHALAYGFDHHRGGVARGGPRVGNAWVAWYMPSAWREKRWWDQAEMLVATLLAYQWTRDPRYLAAFSRQFDWVWTHQIDHEGGDWFEATAWRDGRALGLVKGHEWKDPYHGARALMEVSRGLSTLLRPVGG